MPKGEICDIPDNSERYADPVAGERALWHEFMRRKAEEAIEFENERKFWKPSEQCRLICEMLGADPEVISRAVRLKIVEHDRLMRRKHGRDWIPRRRGRPSGSRERRRSCSEFFEF